MYHKECKNSADLMMGPFVILGLEQMNELDSLPDNVVDHEHIHRENLAVKYTKAVEPDPILLHSLRANLSSKLGK